MECGKIREKIDLLIDGYLPVEEEGKVRDHMDKCGDCRRYRDDIEEMGNGIRDYIGKEVKALPDNLILHRIEASLNELEEGKRRGWFIRYRNILIPALVGVVALTLILFYPSSNVPEVAKKNDRNPGEFTKGAGKLRFAATVESLEAEDAEVVLVDRGSNDPKVIWIIEGDGR